MKQDKHWSKVEFLHRSVRNPNIHVKGEHSYYCDAWSGPFESAVVRYLYGDSYSLQTWRPEGVCDRLYIGDYVCIGAEAVILMGGNRSERADWFCAYPFAETVEGASQVRGDTVIGDGVSVGMRAMLMPGIRVGEGAIIAAQAVVTHDVPPYTVVGGNPALPLSLRFDGDVVARLCALKIYDWPAAKFKALRPWLCSSAIDQLEQAAGRFDLGAPPAPETVSAEALRAGIS